MGKQRKLNVYSIGDSEWWISDKDEEDTLAAYCEEYGMKIDEDIGLENVNKCDLDKDGMYWCYEGQNDTLHNLIKVLLNGEKEKVISTEKGDFELKMCDGPCIWIPFRQAIKEFGKYKKPCMIASSEY